MQKLSSDRSHRVGIDIGGTFTDLVLIDDETGGRANGKVLTTPDDPSEAVEEGLRVLLEREDVGASRLKTIIHGTTLVTNALIERRGAPTALLTTEGFRDAVAIGTEHRYDMYDIFLEKPAPLVPRNLRYGIREPTLDDVGSAGARPRRGQVSGRGDRATRDQGRGGELLARLPQPGPRAEGRRNTGRRGAGYHRSPSVARCLRRLGNTSGPRPP